jgi:hypothetical protein
VAAVAIVLGCVLAPVSVLAVGIANQVSNTDRYVANVTPLISEPSIQAALSAKITAEITSRVDIKAYTADASAELAKANLPRLSNLVATFSGPIANGINGFIGTAVARIVASPAMATLWVQGNRVAHAGLVRVLSGQGNGTFSVVNGEVVLSLAPMITEVKDRLSARGLTIVDKIPPVNATFPLFAAPNLQKAQHGYRLLLTLKWVLPILSIALLVGGILVARVRRHALIGAALGFAASMLVLAAGLAIARTIYLNSVPATTLPADAAAALYDTLVRFLREALRVLLVIGLVIAVGAFLTGPSGAAVRTRRAVTSSIGRLRARGEEAGMNTGPVGEWTAAHKRILRVAAVGLVALIFVFAGQPTLALTIWLVIILLLALGIIELVGGGGRPTASAAAPDQ